MCIRDRVLGDLLTEDGPGPEEQFEKTDLRNAVHEVMGKVLSPKAVSYTHLDVYKRQLYQFLIYSSHTVAAFML